MRYAQVYRCASETRSDWAPYWVELPADLGAPVERYGLFVYATDNRTAAEVATVTVAIFESTWR